MDDRQVQEASNTPTGKLEALHAAIGRALSSWASVESSLSEVFAVCLNEYNLKASHSAFWSVVSFEARLTMSDSVIRQKLTGHDDLLTEWNAIHNRLIKKNRKRNKIAHGQAIHFGKSMTDVDAVLVPFMASNLHAKGLSPGDMEHLTIKQIKESTGGFHKADSRLQALFWQIIERKLVAASRLEINGKNRRWQPPKQDRG